jgi:S1-C subfamily serine protease
MIMLEQPSNNSGSYRAPAGSDRRAGAASPLAIARLIYGRSAGTALLAVLVSAASLSPMPGSVTPAATATKGVVVSGVPVDWRQPWGRDNRGTTNPPGADGYPVATAVSRPAGAAESKGVVVIDTVLPYANARAAGTGMVLTASGQVLTSYHVVEGASKIKVTVAETGKTYQATVVGSDQTADVALLQLKGAGRLTTIKIDNDKTSIGDKVTAVGNAGGTGTLSAAKGKIVSLKASITTAAEGPVASETLRAMIETTADVVSGDSGGPLYDADGEVVGIDTAASSGREINGYAVPIQRALGIVQQIRSGKESAMVRVGPAPFLGVELSDASSSEFGYPGAALEEPSGATVEGIVSGTAAAQAGLEAGDQITALSGHAITTAEDVAPLVADHDPGDRIKIVWIDQVGTQHAATVTLGASPVA